MATGRIASTAGSDVRGRRASSNLPRTGTLDVSQGTVTAITSGNARARNGATLATISRVFRQCAMPAKASMTSAAPTAAITRYQNEGALTVPSGVGSAWPRNAPMPASARPARNSGICQIIGNA